MEVFVVLNRTASTNIYAGVYPSLLEAQKAVALTYKNGAGGRANETVTFNPLPSTGASASDYDIYKSRVNGLVVCSYTTQYGDSGQIIRQNLAKCLGDNDAQLFGF